MTDYDWYVNSFEAGKAISPYNNSVCYILPDVVNSFGVWNQIFNPNDPNVKPFYAYAVPAILMTSIGIFFTWQLVHFGLKRLGCLSLTSQIIAGILLSQTVCRVNNNQEYSLFKSVFRDPLVDTLAAFGYTIFMFLIGVKMDVGIIRTTGKKAMGIGVGIVLIPTTILSIYFLDKLDAKKNERPVQVEYTVVMANACLTGFPVVSTLMYELKMQNSGLGRLALSSALIADVLSASLAVIAGCIQRLVRDRHTGIVNTAAVSIFVLFAFGVFKPAMVWVVKMTPSGKSVENKYLYAIIIVMFGSGVYVDKLDVLLPMGPLMLGLLVPSGAPLGATLVKKYEPFVFKNLLPSMIVICAMKHNVKLLSDMRMKGSDIFTMMLLASSSKLLVTFFLALLWKMPLTDSIALAFAMTKKGVVELVNALFSVAHQHITPGAYTVTITNVLINSYVIPMVVRYLYDPSKKYVTYKKHDIESNQQIRMILCIHKPDNINPMMNLLEASCGTKQEPTHCCVLHLIELIGQAQPIFISHQSQIRKSGSLSVSDNVIIAFDRCQRHFWGRLSLKTFTSVSTTNFMHEDICTLALDNLATLIVLPFHRTWSVDGSTIVSDSVKIRAVTSLVLELAPCSVGVLVDRSRLGGKTLKNLKPGETYKICLVFLGGKDDREALALAKLMARDTNVDLTVVRFKSQTAKANPHDWEGMIESAQLQDVMANSVYGHFVAYMEEFVNEGTETASALRQMINDYDLFLVGRKGGTGTDMLSGLEEWSEFDELGTIGDYLASTDLDSKASVLVVRQQYIK